MKICQLGARSRGVWCQGEWEGNLFSRKLLFLEQMTLSFLDVVLQLQKTFCRLHGLPLQLRSCRGKSGGVTHQETMEKSKRKHGTYGG